MSGQITATTPSRWAYGGIPLMLLYGVAGPPIGGLIAYPTLGIAASSIVRDANQYVTALPLVLAYSYVFGGIPALATGVAAALIRRRGRAISYTAVAAVGACAAGLFFMFRAGFFAPGGGLVNPPLSGLLGMMLGGAASAAICRLLGRRLHGPAE